MTTISETRKQPSELLCDVLFLAAGYGTRLERDLRAAGAARAHLAGVPKALLPVHGALLLDRWLAVLADPAAPNGESRRGEFLRRVTRGGSKGESNGSKGDSNDLCDSKDVLGRMAEGIFVVSNGVSHAALAAWAAARGVPETHVVCDGTMAAAARLGAVGDLALAARSCRIGADRPLLVVAADTLLLDDFVLARFLDAYQRLQEPQGSPKTGASLVAHYPVAAPADTLRSGILRLQDTPSGGPAPAARRVVDFLEKPHPDATTARDACPCFYLLHPDAVALIDVFLAERAAQGASLDEMDATGTFIAWLIHRHPTFSFEISGRLDIGGLDTLIHAESYLAP